MSFLKNTPQAITLSAIRPYPSDVRHILSLAAAIEINVLIFMFLLFIFWRTNTYNNESKNLIYFCVFFSITLLLAIGFSVNNLGAIVRYRSVIIPLLVIPMAAYINWNQILSFFVNNIRNKSQMSFDPGNIDGFNCDTGGNMHYYIKNNKHIQINSYI